jgi:hypothetical protein
MDALVRDAVLAVVNDSTDVQAVESMTALATEKPLFPAAS